MPPLFSEKLLQMEIKKKDKGHYIAHSVYAHRFYMQGPYSQKGSSST